MREFHAGSTVEDDGALASDTGSPRILRRDLGLWAAIAVTMGTMIGTGIFLKPAEVAREAGSFEMAMMAWVVGGILVLFGALSYAELGAALPDAGAQYVYLGRGLSPVWGYLYGWRLFIVSVPATNAAYASATALFMTYLIPELATQVVRIGSITLEAAKVLALGIVLVVTTLNWLSARSVGRLQVGLTLIKVLSLVLAIGAGTLALGEPRPVASPVTQRLSANGFLIAVSATLWAYSGWSGVLRLGSELKDPGRSIPRAMFGGFGATAILFLLVNLACFSVLSFSEVAASPHVVSDMLERTIGVRGADFLTVMMIVSTLGAFNATTLTASRIPYALARDGYFPRPLAWLTPRGRSPVVSVTVPALVTAGLVLTGSFDDATALMVLAQWSFLALGIVALIRLRKTEPNLRRPVRAWGYPVVPLIFALMATALAVALLIRDPLRSSIGAVLIASGLLFYRKQPGFVPGASVAPPMAE